MRKSLLLLLLFLILDAGIVMAQELAVSISTGYANQGSYVTGYDKEFKLIQPGSDLTWTAKNFSNNNSAWNDIRCGSKTSATTATVTTDFAIDASIVMVEVDVTRYKAGSSNNMSSMSLLVSPNADMSGADTYDVDISQLPASAGSTVTLSIPVTAPAPDMYYQLKVNMPKVYSEGSFSVNSIRYYEAGLAALDGAHEVTLDFTDRNALLEAYMGENDIEPSGEYPESASNNLNGVTFVKDAVSVHFEKGDATIVPRWWTSKVISPELRLNPDNTITVDVTETGYRLQRVKFLQGNADNSYFSHLDSTTAETDLGESTFTDKTWNAPEDGIVESLKLTFHDYCRCGQIKITYFEYEQPSGIENIAADNDGNSQPTEYFNLQGVKVDGGNLLPGLYIRRQGQETVKIHVK